MPEAVREHFSARHAEIMEEALRARLHQPRAASRRSSARRATESASSRASAAVAEWRARAAEHGFGERELARRPRARARRSSTPDYHARLRAPTRSACSGPQGLTQPQLHLHPPRGDPGARRGPPRGRARRASSSASPTTSSRARCVALDARRDDARPRPPRGALHHARHAARRGAPDRGGHRARPARAGRRRARGRRGGDRRAARRLGADQAARRCATSAPARSACG